MFTDQNTLLRTIRGLRKLAVLAGVSRNTKYIKSFASTFSLETEIVREMSLRAPKVGVGSENHILRSGKKPFIKVSVDGNISSGKSTLVNALEKCIPEDFPLKVKIVPEPLEKWMNVDGHNLLGKFYEDTVKNGFLFQHYVQLTRLMDTIDKSAEINQPPSESIGKVRIMERSLQNNRYCFVELAKRQGNLEPVQYAVLVEWFNWLEKNMDLSLDVIIYLRTSPKIVFERMKLRGRAEESSVPLKYLEDLHDTYEEWLGGQDNIASKGNNGQLRKQKVIIVDANKSKDEVTSDCVDLFKEFIKSQYTLGTKHAAA